MKPLMKQLELQQQAIILHMEAKLLHFSLHPTANLQPIKHQRCQTRYLKSSTMGSRVLNVRNEQKTLHTFVKLAMQNIPDKKRV